MSFQASDHTKQRTSIPLQRPPHPGTLLSERFLAPLAISPSQLAEGLGVSLSVVTGLIQGDVDLDAELAIRLGLFFQVPPTWWLAMQARYDTENSPLLAKLHEMIQPYDKLHHVLITPNGVRHIQPPATPSKKIETITISKEFLSLLRTQANLSEPRPEREVEMVVYKDGTPALIGR